MDEVRRVASEIIAENPDARYSPTLAWQVVKWLPKSAVKYMNRFCGSANAEVSAIRILEARCGGYRLLIQPLLLVQSRQPPVGTFDDGSGRGWRSVASSEGSGFEWPGLVAGTGAPYLRNPGGALRSSVTVSPRGWILTH